MPEWRNGEMTEQDVFLIAVGKENKFTIKFC